MSNRLASVSDFASLLFRRRGRMLLPLLAIVAQSLFAADTFEPLIIQDADPAGSHPGLTEFRSSGGQLNLQIQAVYALADPNGPNMPSNPELGTPDQQFIYPRLAYYCKDSTHAVVSYAGPFLRVQPGDHIHIQFTNALSTQRTNLHFHGLEVSPNAADSSGAFGDFVSRPYVESTAPGNTRTYDFTIPSTQPPGPYWYHAHVHGVAENQVACGLGGALYVEGSVPAYINTLQGRFAPLLASNNPATASLARQTLSQVTTTLGQMPHDLLVLKDFWTPGLGPINGPLEQSVNGKVTYSTDVATAVGPSYTGTPYVVQYGAGAQLWDIVNESADNYYILKLSGPNTSNLGFYVLGRDAIPDDTSLDNLVPESALFIPPSGRITAIIPTDALKGGAVNIVAQPVNPLGDFYFQEGNQAGQRPIPWNIIKLIPGGSGPATTAWSSIAVEINELLGLTSSFGNAAAAFTAQHGVDATYVLYEPPNPVNGLQPPEPAPVTVYRLADAKGNYLGIKGPADPYDNYEPPIAQLTPGQPQRWIIQNNSTEWHMFHLHQCHFRVERFTMANDLVHPENNQQPPTDNQGNPFYAVNEPPPAGSGKVVGQPYYSGLVDTVSIPNGMQVWLTLPLTEGPQIAGQFVMHCHILNHEDSGMMANVVAGDYSTADAAPGKSVPHLAPREVARVQFKQPASLKDASGQDLNSDLFRQNDFSLVTFGYTTCQGACPMTVEKCVSALGRLKPAEAGRISPFFVSVDVERDDSKNLAQYAQEHALSPAWQVLLDTNLGASSAFGARRLVSHKRDGSLFLRHSTTIYLVDRSMKIRAVFDEEDSVEEMSRRMVRELEG